MKVLLQNKPLLLAMGVLILASLSGCALYPYQIEGDQDDAGRFWYNSPQDTDTGLSLYQETGGPYGWGPNYFDLYHYRGAEDPHRYAPY